MSLPAATTRICQYAAAAGLLSHWTYFIKGEHHLEAPLLSFIFFTAPTVLFLAESYTGKDGLFAPFLRTSAIILSFLVPLWTSMIVYRLFFHRLRKFPGPVGAKISKWWHVAAIAPRSNNYMWLDGMHRQYGDFVRTGPTEISIFHPDAAKALLGPGTKCVKAAWYDIAVPLTSLHTERDKALHDKRRRVWDKGFATRALRGYENKLAEFNETLMERLRKSAGQAISATTEFQFYSFDVMGYVAFGRSFEMMESGKVHFALKVVKEGMAPMGALTPVPWFVHTLTKIPGAASGVKALIKWSADQVDKRRLMQHSTDSSDVMSHLIDAYEASSKTAVDRLDLNGDSRLIIVAGSDTTSATLTNLFYYLASDKSQVEKLRKELDPVDKSGFFEHEDIKNLPHLNGVIDETLRLHPPVPAGVLRNTPPEGITIGDTFIPGNVTVVPPLYTLQRLESCYGQPNDFIPERWYSKPELIMNKNAYAPFSLGAMSCVGKQLALMELRTVTARIISSFDVCLAPGENGSALFDGLKDCFTVEQQDLKVIFTPRAKA